MQKKLSVNIRIYVLVSEMVFLTACAPYLAKLNPSLPQTLKLSRLPINIGYYFSPETTKLEYLLTVDDSARSGRAIGSDIIYPVDKASVDLFLEAYRQLFEQIVPIQEIPPVVSSASNLSAIIQIDLEELSMPIAYATEIKY